MVGVVSRESLDRLRPAWERPSRGEASSVGGAQEKRGEEKRREEKRREEKRREDALSPHDG